MMSVLADVSLARAGFDRELRDRIAAAWRAEDFHTAGNLIPDELLDAFMLCGTREDVAAAAMRFHAEADLELPLLQPVLQEEAQIDELLAAARLYANAPDAAQAAADAASRAGPPAAPASGRSAATAAMPSDIAGYSARRTRGRPHADAGARAPAPCGSDLGGRSPVRLHRVGHPGRGRRRPRLGRRQVRRRCRLSLALVGAVALHSGTNIVNEIYDVRQGVDTITSPRASHAILKGRIGERDAFRVAMLFFALAVAVGLGLTALRGWPIVALGLHRPRRRLLLHGTAVPVQVPRARRAAGVPADGTADDRSGSYFAVTGTWSLTRARGCRCRSACWWRRSCTATSGVT